MKTKEEIEQLANEWTNGIDESYKVLLKEVYIKGYTKCQEDMADKKYTKQDLINAIQYGIDLEAGNIKFDYKKYPDSFTQYIDSLNK
jgi:hypothetical protein